MKKEQRYKYIAVINQTKVSVWRNKSSMDSDKSIYRTCWRTSTLHYQPS